MSLKKYVLLITDDEENILIWLKSELTEIDDNFEVVVTKSGYESLDYIQKNQVDLLLTDIAMPDMDGYELYRRTKEIRPQLPIIMMTGFGYDPNHTVVNAKKEGLRDVLLKPFDINKLLTRIYKRQTKNEN
jgi:YesN/AraC family two-component response regulator